MVMACITDVLVVLLCVQSRARHKGTEISLYLREALNREIKEGTVTTNPWCVWSCLLDRLVTWLNISPSSECPQKEIPVSSQLPCCSLPDNGEKTIHFFVITPAQPLTVVARSGQ